MAVFYRTNAQSRVVEEAFMRSGIPYKVVGGTRFYDRREIKDALAYVKAVVNPADEVSVKRVLNVPKRGVGDTTVGRLDAWANAHGVTFREALGHAEEAGVSGPATRGIRQFVELLDELDVAVAEGPAAAPPGRPRRLGLPPGAGGRAHGRVGGTAREPGRARRVGAGVRHGGRRSSSRSPSWPTPTPSTATTRAVVLMTLHSAKGLEFPVVFLVGCEEGVFPHLRALTEPEELEEERRLAYVGITRARERLHLSHAWSRMLFGVDAVQPAVAVPRRDPRRPRRARRAGPPAVGPGVVPQRRGRPARRVVDRRQPRAHRGVGHGQRSPGRHHHGCRRHGPARSATTCATASSARA